MRRPPYRTHRAHVFTEQPINSHGLMGPAHTSMPSSELIARIWAEGMRGLFIATAFLHAEVREMPADEQRRFQDEWDNEAEFCPLIAVSQP